MVASEALRAAFFAATSRPRVSYKGRRTPEEISADVSMCFDFSRKSGVLCFPISRSLDLNYRDQFEYLTLRKVDICGVFSFNGRRYFEGYCHLRNEFRTFLYEGIASAYDGGHLVFDPSSTKNDLSDEVGINLAITALQDTDFFIHPRVWGDYRRPVSVLFSAWRERQFDEWQSFEEVSKFVGSSFNTGVWSGWRGRQQAYAVGLLGLTIETLFLDHKSEYLQIRGGRFNRSAFQTSWLVAVS